MEKEKTISFYVFLYLYITYAAADVPAAGSSAEKTPTLTSTTISSISATPELDASRMSTSTLVNHKKVLTDPVPTSLHQNATTPRSADCVCDGVLLPRLGKNGKELEICPECKCKHEARNTTLIKVVVIIVIWIISILVIYMLFLMCLDPLLNKRVKANYQEHTNEDDDTVANAPGTMAPENANHEFNSRNNVLNRVGHQQDKWKRQVLEQRRHIYDRRTMLN